MEIATTALRVFNNALGIGVSPQDLTLAQMALRCVVVFVFGVLLIRVADRRFLGRNAGFDVLLGIVLGSVLSRAINGQAAFFPTLGACVVLVVLHRLLGTAAVRWHPVSLLVKGRTCTLVANGAIDRKALHSCKMSEEDLEENLRINGNVAHPEGVAEARLERNGMVSVVPKGKAG